MISAKWRVLQSVWYQYCSSHFRRLAHEPRFTLVHEKFYSRWPHGGKRLSVERHWNVEIGRISIFFNSGVGCTACLRGPPMEKGCGRRNKTLPILTEWRRWEKETSFMRPFLRETHRAFDRRCRSSADLPKCTIIPLLKNDKSASIVLKCNSNLFRKWKIPEYNRRITFHRKENESCETERSAPSSLTLFVHSLID